MTILVIENVPFGRPKSQADPILFSELAINN